MAHNNCTVSVATSTESSGDSVSAGTLNSSEVLVITPNAGYNVAAASFSIGDPLPIEVSNVTFTDTTTANQPGNLVNVTVTYSNFSMPAANKEILIDIDGEAIRQTSAIADVTCCIIDNVVEEGFCSDIAWPKGIRVGTGNPISSTVISPDVAVCLGQFQDITEGTGITASTPTTVGNWINPLFATGLWSTLYGGTAVVDTATTTQHSGSVTPNTTVTLFTKTFWMAPGNAFHPLANPFYALNTHAVASGNYTVEETPDIYNVDKNILIATTDTNIIYCDTTDVYPGMQVSSGYDPVTQSQTSPALDFLSYQHQVYQWFLQDVRVLDVDRVNNTVTLTEKHTGTTVVGNTINFSSKFNCVSLTPVTSHPSDDYCLTKTFTVKYNVPTTDVVCAGVGPSHEIDFAMYGGNNIIEWTLNNPAALPKITNVELNTLDIRSKGETRTITVHSSGDSEFDLSINRDDGNQYDFTTGLFSGRSSTLTGLTAGNGTPYTTTINFPCTDTDFTYTTIVSPTTRNVNENLSIQTTFATGVSDSYTIYQYLDKALTFTSVSTAKGLDLGSFTSPAAITAVGGRSFGDKGRAIATWTGTITKEGAGGEMLYDLGLAEDATLTDAGSFTNATANGGEMEITVGVTGSGTAELTVTAVGRVFKQPTSATAVSLDLDAFIGMETFKVPNVGVGGNVELDDDGYATVNLGSLFAGPCTPANVIAVRPGAAVAIDLRSYDNDTNKASKTLATGDGPTDSLGVTKGSLGSHSGGSVTYTADTNISASDVGKIITFTYTGAIASYTSPAATVYIIIKE